MSSPGEEARTSMTKGQQSALGEADLPEERILLKPLKHCYTVGKPSKVAKASGTPNSVMWGWLAVGAHVLRANRSAQASR
jgi:hypothetical protein